MVKAKLSLDTCCKIHGSGKFDFSYEINGKMASNIDEHQSLGAQGLDFYDFGRFWRRLLFYVSWICNKADPNCFAAPRPNACRHGFGIAQP